MRQYPRWIHHPEQGSVIVRDEAHEKALGEGWFDSPAHFPTENEAVEPVRRGPGRPKKVQE